MILLGLVLAGCPRDQAGTDEPGAVDASTPAPPPAPAPAPDEPVIPSATPYTGEDAARMTLNSKPWGRIFMDGKQVGNTPKREYAIAPGEHQIEIHCGPCLTDKKVQWSFTVAAGEQYSHVSTDFGETPPPVDPDHRQDAPDPDLGPDLSGGFVQPYEGGDQAFLTLDSKPWSHVYMDGQYLGKTPKKQYTVAPGTHRLKFECGACADPQPRELEIDVAPGETYTNLKVEYKL